MSKRRSAITLTDLDLKHFDSDTRHVGRDFAKYRQEIIARVRFQIAKLCGILEDDMGGIWAAWSSALQGVPKSVKITAKETCAFCTDVAFVPVPEFFDIHDPIAIYD